MTTRSELGRWFDAGIDLACVYMLVVCDTYDYTDYPIYARTPQEAIDKYREHDGKNMQRVMEVYDLKADKHTQLYEARAFHLPALLH